MNYSELESQKRSSSSEFELEKQAMEPTAEPKSSNFDLVLSTKTPDKPASLPGRSRSSDVSVSLRVVQRTAETGLRRSEDRTGEIKSAKRQILSSPRKPGSLMKLPERYEILGEFFNGLDTSIRLLKLRGYSTTFANISPKIECLTNRRFMYGHLAQMKHIFPEAILIKRVLKYDETTCCMKPDLHVTLNTDAIPYDETKCESKNMVLRKMFRSRLTDFFRAHPKGEIPEEVLPEPFNPSKTSSALLKAYRYERFNIPKDGLEQDHRGLSVAATTSTDSAEEQQLSVTPHLLRSPPNRHYIISPSEKQIPASALSEMNFSATPESAEECISHRESTILATPIKDSSISSKDMASTPDQHASTPARLMSATPALQPSKRCIMMSPDDDSVGSPNKLVRRPSRTRSLKFDTLEEDGKAGDNIGEKFDVDEGKSSDHETGEEAEEESSEKINDELSETSYASSGDNDDDDILDILPESLLQSIKEREKAAADEHNPAISLAKRRRRIIASLPKLFNVIHFMFQSSRRTVITKEELLYKIIAGQGSTTDRREAEEQLSLMIELVPEWISETKASSGDLLVRINKISAADTIRARIEEATTREVSTVP